MTGDFAIGMPLPLCFHKALYSVPPPPYMLHIYERFRPEHKGDKIMKFSDDTKIVHVVDSEAGLVSMAWKW